MIPTQRHSMYVVCMTAGVVVKKALSEDMTVVFRVLVPPLLECHVQFEHRHPIHARFITLPAASGPFH